MNKIATVCFSAVLVSALLFAGAGFSSEYLTRQTISFQICAVTQTEAKAIKNVMVYPIGDGHFEARFTPTPTPFGTVPCTEKIKVKMTKGQVSHLMVFNYGSTAIHELKIGSDDRWITVRESMDPGRFVWDVLPEATDRPTITLKPEP